MFKWSVIGDLFFQTRYEFLSQLLNEQGWANEIQFVKCGPVDFPEHLGKLLMTSDSIRIESPFRELVLKQFNRHPFLTQALGASDVLVKKEKQWWPESALYFAFNQLFSRFGEAMDLNSEVMVVGAGGSGRIAAASAVRAGFKRINIANKYDDQGLELISELREKFFGIHFEFFPQDTLVLLPGVHGLVINTTPVVETNDLLAELTYLNFLRPEGMIWDLILDPPITPLVREGLDVGVTCVSGWELATYADLQWLELVGGPPVSELFSKYSQKFIPDKNSDVGRVTKNVTTE